MSRSKLWHFMDPEGDAEWMVVEAADEMAAWRVFERETGRKKKALVKDGYECYAVKVRR